MTAEVLFPKLKEVHNIFRILNVKRRESEETVLMTDRLEFHFLELERVNKLNKILAQQGRTEDLLKTFEDPVFQQQMLEEFGL